MPNRIEQFGGRNLYQELLDLRDTQRERFRNGLWLISEEDIPWEINRQGKMKWYLHPGLGDVCINTQLFYMQELPTGSKSGRIHFQGGQCILFLEGRGHTMLDGVRYDWESTDAMNVPLKTEGVVIQHFNESSTERALFVVSEANMTDTLGVDRGSGFEQLENCPEYGK
jgi:gentisate 1,2-dioxygenase